MINPYFYIGKNPTVDILVFKQNSDITEVLLIRRSKNAHAESNKWAIPGGFQDSNAKYGEYWKEDKESSISAALRELQEETGLILTEKEINNISHVGEFSGSGRDPRDNKISWSVSNLFKVELNKLDKRKIEGLDDADYAKWINVEDAILMDLAFDHNRLLDLARDK